MTKGKDKAVKTVGKPKRVFTDEQIGEMGDLALAGCQTKTIASLMDIPRETIDSRPDIQQLLSKKRAERKLTLREQQNDSSKKGNVTMQIWLGKQVLDQKDKQDITSGDKPIPAQIIIFAKPTKDNDNTD